MLLPSKGTVHMIGIGGIGMSSLAQWFKAHGWKVVGSNISESEIVSQIQKQGIRVRLGHKASHISLHTSLVVYSAAIPKNNPEIKRAKKLGIKILSYPQMLGVLTNKYETIAVAGSHGKSTTTALVSLLLIKGRLDPTVIIGTKLKEFGGKNFRRGKSKYLVVEADEYKGAFWNYSPTLAVITNIDAEHLDFYKNLPRVKKGFIKFINNVKSKGTLILNRDDNNLYSLKKRIQKLAKKKSLKVQWFSINGADADKLERVIKIPGKHNLSNALAAFTAGTALNIGKQTILSALSSYRGAWRRMEYRGRMRIANRRWQIFDDYAHHPTEIKAALSGFREKYPKAKIVCVFQPHQAKRLRALFKEFALSFSDADYLILLPIYKVAGRDKFYRKYSPEKLSEAIQRKRTKTEVRYCRSQLHLKDELNKILEDEKNAVIVMMGAGNIDEFTDRLLK